MSAEAAGTKPRTIARTASPVPGRIAATIRNAAGERKPSASLDRARRAREARHVPVEGDLLVIGSGIAGLTCALECARHARVVLVTKDRLPESSSQYAQGGIASVWSPEDSFESHIDDTLAAGAGLCRREVVETVVREGPAGVPVANMEFFQFHPTCLYHPAAKSFLLTEALRGEGAILRRPDGEPFMARYDERAELAPRDVVARAIDNEMKVHGFECVYLDISHRDADWIRRRFPTVYERCLQFGFDLGRQPVPVVPAAHYSCGGIVTDVHGRTAIERLYACGEVACTGLHGANRLASNSLLEALVFGRRAAAHALDALATDRRQPPVIPPWDPGRATDSDESVVVAQNWDEIRRFMWNYVGIVRTDRRLARARERITLLLNEIREYYWDFLLTSDLAELRNLATVAELVIACAASRPESRGLHYTIDHPRTDPAWAHDTVVRRCDGEPPDVVRQPA